MKKLQVTIILAFAISLTFNTLASAQDGSLKLGAGLVFGTGVFEFDEIDNDLGIRAEGIYTINEKFRAGANFTFFFPKEEGEVKATVFGINFDGNYIFYSEDQLTAYGLAGINIAIVNLDIPNVDVPGFGSFGGSDSETEFGLNLGGGVEYALDFGDLFGELKLGGLGGNADQFVIAAGARFGI